MKPRPPVNHGVVCKCVEFKFGSKQPATDSRWAQGLEEKFHPCPDHMGMHTCAHTHTHAHTLTHMHTHSHTHTAYRHRGTLNGDPQTPFLPTGLRKEEEADGGGRGQKI